MNALIILTIGLLIISSILFGFFLSNKIFQFQNRNQEFDEASIWSDENLIFTSHNLPKIGKYLAAFFAIFIVFLVFIQWVLS